MCLDLQLFVRKVLFHTKVIQDLFYMIVSLDTIPHKCAFAIAVRTKATDP